ncbi:hypothetical protein PSP31121_05192 [Pandoraea sputorum]|uniref:Uncharacterized protein n=1 Tax=Pandoraea sputorum TaxID=93222 RepID=A0A5E5BJY2_9BURK|nr:hypothetical protein PSP31121_05192 [Pandoraea sputorum]
MLRMEVITQRGLKHKKPEAIAFFSKVPGSA